MEIKHTDPQNEERLPWHKPEVQRLVIVQDTKNTSGSGTDGGTFEFIT
jgi:hypothetical protein